MTSAAQTTSAKVFEMNVNNNHCVMHNLSKGNLPRGIGCIKVHSMLRKHQFIWNSKILHSFLFRETPVHLERQDSAFIPVPENTSSSGTPRFCIHSCSGKHQFIWNAKILHSFLFRKTPVHLELQDSAFVPVPENTSSSGTPRFCIRSCSGKHQSIWNAKILHSFLFRKTPVHLELQDSAFFPVLENTSPSGTPRFCISSCSGKHHFIWNSKILHSFLFRKTPLHLELQDSAFLPVPENTTSSGTPRFCIPSCSGKHQFIWNSKILHSFLFRKTPLHLELQDSAFVPVPENTSPSGTPKLEKKFWEEFKALFLTTGGSE
uniref:Uncharacterized protein n=1 Tax=Sphaerodactylus townsendi TaxID=933632 RepID=A0ACB8FXD1_9SAUR